MIKILVNHSENITHGFIRRFFEGNIIQVKLVDGTSLTGKLFRVDSSTSRYSDLGNLILEDGRIIRASSVRHIAIKVNER